MTDLETIAEVEPPISAQAEQPDQAEQVPADPPIKRLWTSLRTKDQRFTRTFDEFQQDMQEPQNVEDLHRMLTKNFQFAVPLDQFEQDLGLKKKASVAPSAAGGAEPGAPVDAGGPATEAPVLTPAERTRGDQEFTQQVAPLTAGAPVGTADAPGGEPVVSTAGAPEPPLTQERAPAAEEQAYLDALAGDARPELATNSSGGKLFREYGDLPELADGHTRVAVPADYAGAVPASTYKIPASTDPEQRYFDRPLSKQVAGEGEQGLGMAAARNFNNLIADGFKGLATGLDDATRLISQATGTTRGGAFADVADALEKTKQPVAPYYTERQSVLAHPTAKNLLMATSDVAGMAVPLVAQALAPEAGAGRLAAQVLGTGAGLMFDGQIIQGAHDRATAAGLSPDQTALYTLFDGGLSVLTFKAGGALLGKVAGKLTPEQVKSEILRETYRTLAARPASQQLTRQELAGVLQQATAAATPRLLKAAAEGGKLGALFGVNEAKTILTEAAARQTIGAKFTVPTLGEAVQRVVGAAAEGTVIGGVTGAAHPAPPRTLALGQTPAGRPLSVEVNEAGEPVRYLDDQGPVDFGKTGPPPAVQAAVAQAQAAAPAPLAADDLLTHQRIPVYKYRGSEQLYADYDQQGRATRLYNEQGRPFSLDDVQVRAAVEQKWPGASGEAGVGAGPAAARPAAGPLPSPEPAAQPAAPAVDLPGAASKAEPTPPPAYGTPAQNRAAGAFEKQGQVYTRQAPLGERVARGKETTAEFASGVQQPVQYAVMEASDLQPSHLNGTQNLHHFLPEAQPKNRSAAFDPASQKAIADIAASPDLNRLGEAPNAYSGAPIVNGRGEALQGNGRAAGIRQHYQQGGEVYKQDVVAAAERAGIPASETARFREPVLVRVADVSDQRARELGNYTAADTESGGKRRLDVRQASGKLDERGRADLARLATPQGEDTLTETLRANSAELLRLLRRAGAVNDTQLQTMTKADGTLTPQGVEDLASLYRHQLFAEGDSNLPELFAELPAAAQNGLDRAGGALLGLPESASLVPDVQQAIGGVRELRASGSDFATWAGQADAFRGGQAPRERYSPLTLRLIELLTTEKRPTVIARYFQEYAAAVRGEADSLFEATPPKSRAEASQQVFGVADSRPVDSPSQPVPSSYERPESDVRNPRAAEEPPRRHVANERPAAPESPAAPGPAAAAGDAARPRVDAGDTEPRPAAGIVPAGTEPVAVKVSHTDYVVGQDAAGRPTVTNRLTRAPLSEKHPHYRAALNLAREARRPARAPLAAGAVVDTEPTTFRNRAEADAWARTHIQGRQVTNTATGEAIHITRAGIDKALSGKAFDKTDNLAAHLAAVQVLPELLESAEPRGELEPDKRGDQNVEGVQRFGARLRMGEQDYSVKLTVKKFKREGNRFYTHEIERVEVQPAQDFENQGPDLAKVDTKKADVVPERPATGQGLQSETGQADPNTGNTAAFKANITPAPAPKLPEAAPTQGPAPAAGSLESLRALNTSLQQASARGDQAAANELATQAEAAAEAAAGGRNELGHGPRATRLLAEHTPAIVVHLAEQAAAHERSAAETKLAQQAATEGQQVRQEKGQALDHALATPAVRAVRDEVAGKTPPTSTERLATIRAERARLLDELRQGGQPTGQVYSTLVPLTPAQARAAELHLKIFRTYVQEGVVRVADLVARWKREAGPLVPGLSDDALAKLATTALADHRAAVRQGVAELGTTLDKIARDYTTSAEQVGSTLAQRFADEAGLAPADAQRYADAIKAEFDRRIGAARQRRVEELRKRTTGPAGRQPAAEQVARLRELFTLSPTSDAAILDHLRHTTDLPGMSDADAAHLRQLADAVNAAPAGFQRDEAVGKLLDATARQKGIDWLEVSNALWYANVLSGYKTHALNLFANTLQTGSEALVHTTHALLTGKGRYATASGKGLIQGLHRGALEAFSVLTTGREVSRDGVKFEAPGLLEYQRFAGGAANPVNYLKFVGRALRAGDVLFSTGLKEMRAHELAVKEALAEGTNGEPSTAVWARVNEKLYHTTQRLADARAQATAEGLTGNDHARRVYEIAEQSRPVGLVEEAREYGTRAVFNGDVKGTLGWVTTGIQYMTQGIDLAGFKPAKLVIPFTRVICNVANEALNYTPVGAARAGVSLAREQLGRGGGGHLFGGKPTSKMQQQLTGEERGHLAIKSVLGAAVAVTAYALTHNQDEHGNPTLEISGAGTGTPSKDAQLRADGWQPYSIKAGGKWYSYANTPVGVMLSVIGNLCDGEKYRGEHIEKSDEALGALALNSFRAMQVVKDQTALKGATDFLAVVDSKNPEEFVRWAQRQAVSTVKGYVPWSAMLTQLAKDGEELAGQPRKQARSISQSLVQDIPVARNSLHDALDVLGDPLPVDTDRLMSSAPYRDAPTRAVWDWLEKNNLFITVPNKNSGGAMVLRAHQGEETPMTDDEYFAFMKKRGQLLREALHHQLPDLQKLDAKAANKKLEAIVKRVTRTAKQQVFTGEQAVGKE